MTGDPHAEYRRQAAAHFGRDGLAETNSGARKVQSSSQPPPRIFRGGATDSVAPADAAERLGTVDDTTRMPAAPEAVAQPLIESTERFPAGTTYGAGGDGRRLNRPPSPPRPAAFPPPMAPPAIHRPPQAYRPPPPAPVPTSVPPPPPPPRLSAALPPPVVEPANGVVPPVNAIAFNVMPYHVLRVACVVAVIAAIVAASKFGWILIAVGCAGAEWYTRTRQTAWPVDVQDLLHRKRVAAAPPPARQMQSATAVIPFRPLTVKDIFLGAFHVVWRNWPTLIGIPAAILGCFAVLIGVVFFLLTTVFSEVLGSLMAGMFTTTLDGGGTVALVLVIMLGYSAFVTALALPADALVLATTVIATDKAVRGERVRLSEVFGVARSRMFAVCRLTLVYYGIFFLPDVILVFATFGLGLGAASLGIVFACFVGLFVVGILLSLAPIALIVEKRGVTDSLLRSVRLAKPAWGRLLGIHLLWAVCASVVLFVGSLPALALGSSGLLLFMIAFPFMISYFRAVQMLIYTDLRIRQESYERELLADWTLNTQFTG